MSMEGGSTKKRAREPREEDVVGSKLPESVITSILSLLPTKEAVRTCVLSKSWIDRWKSITNLQFDDSDLCNYTNICTFCKTKCLSCFYYEKDDWTACISCRSEGDYRWRLKLDQIYIDFESCLKILKGKKEECFVNFLNKVTDNTSLIFSTIGLEIFSFVIYNKRCVSLQNTWISSILKNRRVKNLRIHSYFYKLPFSLGTSDDLFSSSSLQELELRLKVYSAIKVPTTSLHFQQLKFLNLYGVFFDIDPSSDSMNLNLPLVKKFEISNCHWSNGKDVIVQAPLLETISIGQDADFFEVKTHDPCGQSIKFNALHLKEFNYCGYGLSHKIHFPACGSVKITFLEVSKVESEIRRIPFTLLLFQQFHQVKCIKFEDFPLELEALPLGHLPVFSMLSHLELGYVTNIEVIIGFLQNSPVLNTLVLTKGIPKFAKEILKSITVPGCLVSSLRDVKFGKANGEEHELILVKLFIENGRMLERMAFSFPIQKLNSKALKEFKEKLYSFKKCSSFVIVEMSHWQNATISCE